MAGATYSWTGPNGFTSSQQYPTIANATSSASGLDPHISPVAAEYQIERVAKARHFDPSAVKALVEKNTEDRQWRVFGEPRVNVLELNIALDSLR